MSAPEVHHDDEPHRLFDGRVREFGIPREEPRSVIEPLELEGVSRLPGFAVVSAAFTLGFLIRGCF